MSNDHIVVEVGLFRLVCGLSETWLQIIKFSSIEVLQFSVASFAPNLALWSSSVTPKSKAKSRTSGKPVRDKDFSMVGDTGLEPVTSSM